MRALVGFLTFLLASSLYAQDPSDAGKDISFSKVKERKVFYSKESYHKQLGSDPLYTDEWVGVKVGGLQGSFTDDYEKQRLQLNTTLGNALHLQEKTFLDCVHLEGRVETDRPPYYLVGAELPMDRSVNLFVAAVRNKAADNPHLVFGPVVYHGDSITTVFIYPPNNEKLESVTPLGSLVARFRLRDKASPLWTNMEFSLRKYKVEGEDDFTTEPGAGFDLGFQNMSVGYQQVPNWENTLWTKQTFRLTYFYNM